MENPEVKSVYRVALFVLILSAIGGLAFAAGIAWSIQARAGDDRADASGKKNVRVVYPKKTELDFQGLAIEGQVNSPGEFYFQHADEDKFDSLVKRRKNFHREMLRDVVLSK